MIKESAPFADALLQLGTEDGSLELYRSELAKIRGVLEENPELVSLLRYPSMPVKEKEELLDQIFGSGLSETMKNFLIILCKNRKAGDLIEISDEFEKLYDRSQNIERVCVTSAVPLDEEQKEKLAARLKKQLGRNVRISYEVDPSLLGGMKIRTESMIIDGSMTGRLERMKDQLLKS